MTTTTPHHVPTIRRLPPERWGKRLARMRDLAGFTQEEATEELGRYLRTSGATLSRMEKLTDVPPSRSRRQIAWTLAVVYGYAPADLDLGDDDAPPVAVLASLGCADEDGAPVIHGPLSAQQESLFGFAA